MLRDFDLENRGAKVGDVAEVVDRFLRIAILKLSVRRTHSADRFDLATHAFGRA